MFEEIYLARIFVWVVFGAISLVIIGFFMRWRRGAEAARNRQRIDQLAIQLGETRVNTERYRVEGIQGRNRLEAQIGELRSEHARTVLEQAKARLRKENAYADMAEDQKEAGRKRREGRKEQTQA